MGYWIRYLGICLLTVSLVLMPVVAGAQTPPPADQYNPLECGTGASGNGFPEGTVVPNTTLFNADTSYDWNTPDPSDTTSPGQGLCEYIGPTTLIVQHIFSYIICNFMETVNAVLGGIYCLVNYYLLNTIIVLVELYITVYGAQILMGMAQLSTRDSVSRIVKVSIIYVCATKASWAINVIFAFFMGVIATASYEVVNVLSAALGTLPADSVCQSNNIWYNEYSANGDQLDARHVLSIFGFMDYLVCHALIGPPSTMNSRVQGLFISMAFALPPAALMFQWWIVTTIKALVMTLIQFLKSLAAIAFLVSLCPIFLGCYLFQSTAHVFENWLRYLISFSVQVSIILAIIVMWILSVYQFISFFNELSMLTFPSVATGAWGGNYKDIKEWGICSPTFSTDGFGVMHATCEPGTSVANPPDSDGCTVVDKCTPGGSHSFDANPPPVSKTPGTCNPPKNPNWQCDNLDLIKPSELINEGQFLFYLFFNLITLLLITFAFSQMLVSADKIARALAGPANIPPLQGGWGNSLGSMNNFQSTGVGGKYTSAGKEAQKVGASFHKMVRGR